MNIGSDEVRTELCTHGLGFHCVTSLQQRQPSEYALKANRRRFCALGSNHKVWASKVITAFCGAFGGWLVVQSGDDRLIVLMFTARQNSSVLRVLALQAVLSSSREYSEVIYLWAGIDT